MDITNIKNIKALAQIMESFGLQAIDIAQGDAKLRIEKAATAAAPAPQAADKPAALPKADAALPKHPEDRVVDFNNIKEVKSPMVGVFYRAPAPGAEPFVKIGSKVKKGDTLCIIEAMKLMNEITAEFDGEIVDICAENGQVVEYSQVLFKIF